MWVVLAEEEGVVADDGVLVLEPYELEGRLAGQEVLPHLLPGDGEVLFLFGVFGPAEGEALVERIRLAAEAFEQFRFVGAFGLHLVD